MTLHSASHRKPPIEMPWDSNTLSPKEQRTHDAWTLGLLMFTKNPAGLGINIDGMAAEAWTSYINTYKKTSNIVWLNAEQTLQTMTYSECVRATGVEHSRRFLR